MRSPGLITTMRTAGASVALATIATLSLFAAVHHFAQASDQKYVVVASQIRWGIDIQHIKCLSLNRRIANKIFGKDYSDDPKIMSTLRRFFPDKNVSLNDPNCPYALSFNIIIHDIRTVQYHGQISRMLATFVVSKKSDLANGLPTETRSYKNLYLFRSDFAPLDAFEIGLKAFLTPQQKEWQTIVVALPTHA